MPSDAVDIDDNVDDVGDGNIDDSDGGVDVSNKNIDDHASHDSDCNYEMLQRRQ